MNGFFRRLFGRAPQSTRTTISSMPPRELLDLPQPEVSGMPKAEVMIKDLLNYRPKNFQTKELVDPDTYRKFGENSLLVMDIRMLWTIDAIRGYFEKPVYVNDYNRGGTFKYRGFRPPSCSTGASYSQHRFGRAIDFHIYGIGSAEVRKEIYTHPDDDAFKYITRMEEFDGMSWVHIDCAWLPKNQERIHVFKP